MTDFTPFWQALEQLNRPAMVAIEGGSAAGKTTLARLARERYGCTVFHMDDFFLQPHQRTPERLSEPGGNVDRERFLAEVLQPLQRGGQAAYRRYDCAAGALGPVVEVTPAPLVLVEGAYAMHPDLAPYYDFSLFLDIRPDLQRRRILQRNTPEQAQRFFQRWIPLEQRYFQALDVPGRCSMILPVAD